MLRAVEIIRKVAPGADPAYLAAFEAGDDLLAARGINTPLRLAHLLAQFAHETGGFSIKRESMSYTAKRILEVFGVGVHSAGITAPEAKKLARNPEALAERVYGLGNPIMANNLGNTQPGDGFLCRGNSLNQGTGRGFHERATKATGIDFIGNPDLATSPAHALAFAMCEWDKVFVSLSDRNDIRGITKRLNGAYNGYAERVKWFNKIFALLSEDERPAWRTAKLSAATRRLQEQLVSLGYTIKVDGRYGVETTQAVTAFQRLNGLNVDGIAGSLTLDAIKSRLAGKAANPAPSIVPDAPTASQALAPGGSAAALGALGQEFIDKSKLLEPYTELSSWLEYGCAGLLAIGVAILLVGVVRTYVVPAIHKPSAPVAA